MGPSYSRLLVAKRVCTPTLYVRYIHAPFFSAKRQNFPRDLFRIDWYRLSCFLFSVGPTVRFYTTNVPVYKILFFIRVGSPGPGCTGRPICGPNMARFSPRFFPLFFPAIFPRDISPRFDWVNENIALTVLRSSCNGADCYCDPPRRLDAVLDPLRPPPACNI